MSILNSISYKRNILGYDIFISYSRKDGLDYSYNISRHFVEKGYECFIDQISNLTPGKELPASIKRAIRRCQAFIIVGSTGSYESQYVRQEIEIFLEHNSNKPIIPISFEGNINEAVWYSKIEGLAVVNELKENLISSHPSASVLDRIENALIFTKKSARLRRISFIVGAITIMLSGLAIFFLNSARVANNDLKDTRKELTSSKDQLIISGRKLQNTLDSAKLLTSQLDSTNDSLELSQTQLKDVNVQLYDRKYELDIANAFENFRKGSELLQIPVPDEASIYFAHTIDSLRSLQLDPLIGLHARMAADLIDLKAKPIIDVRPAVSFIKVSRDDKQLLVVYDHQDFGGQPDIEDILDLPAFEVYDLTSGKQIMEEPIGSVIGRFIYDIHQSNVLSFEESGHIIIDRNNNNKPTALEKYSLKDGSSKAISTSEISKYVQKPALKNDNAARGQKLIDLELSDDNLYVRHPDVGIDVEYGPRLVDKVVQESPDGRTMVVGTYEGKIMLLDMATGYKRGEIRANPVFAADYTSDSKYAYVADKASIWKIDSRGWPEVNEISVPLLYQDSGWNKEAILDVTISEDGKLTALASQYRLMIYDKQKKHWIKWKLPTKQERVAAMDIDVNNKKVNLVTDKGSIFSGDYISQKSTHRQIQIFNSKCQTVAAWIESPKSVAWVACKKIGPSSIIIQKIPLYGDPKNFEKISIKVPDLRLKQMQEHNQPEIHALAKIDSQLVVIVGDSEAFEDQHPLIGEQLLVAPIDAPASGKSKTLYGFRHYVDNLGEPHWDIQRIYKISSVSNGKRIMAHRELGIMMSVGMDGNLREIQCNLESRDIILDKDGGYNMGIDFSEELSKIELSINHLRRNVNFRYNLPWKFNNDPVFAAINPNGRKIVVVSKQGDILIIDVSKYIIQ